MTSETFQIEQENDAPDSSSSNKCCLSTFMTTTRRQRRTARDGRRGRGRGRGRTPPPVEGGRLGDSDHTPTALLILEMDQLPSEDLFPQAVGDGLVGASTMTIVARSTLAGGDLNITSSEHSSVSYSSVSETPLTPPVCVQNRARNNRFQPDDQTNNHGIVQPGAYVARGRPVGLSSGGHRESRSTTNSGNTSRGRTGPILLSHDDRMSSRSFQWWLRSQEEEQASSTNDGGDYRTNSLAVIDADVTLCSDTSVTEDLGLDFSFSSIPPELRPLQSESEVAMKVIETTATKPLPKKRGLSPKRIIHKIVDSL